MKKMTRRESAFRQKHLSCVRHMTLDPYGPGVVRMHMIPPREGLANEPFMLLLNGAHLVPLNLSWAILLSNFMDALEPFNGHEIAEHDWAHITAKAVAATGRVYPFISRRRLRDDLGLMLDSIIDIARGRTPQAEVELLTLGEYAPHMTAPHRIDLMVSAMTKNGCWHCNQKCLHCYAAGQPMGEAEELSTEEWKAVLDKLRAANIPQITFTGGEPTLRSDLVELVEAAQWFVTRLNTNGRLLTSQLCRSLYEASLDSVQITLYAADAESHNALVGAPGFDDTVQGIRNAVEAGLVVSVNTPLCSLNRNYAKTLRFAHSLGVRYATCSGLIPSGDALGNSSRATALGAEELTDILRDATTAAAALGIELDFTSPGWLDEETLRSLGLTLIPSCGACLSNMAIAPDGTVVPCQSWLGGVTLGHILSDNWNSIWDNEACRAIRTESAKTEHLCQLRCGNRGGEGK